MSKAFTKLKYHVFFGTRDDCPVLTPDFHTRTYGYAGGALGDRGGALVSGGGTSDHIHLLLGVRSTVALSDVIGSIKAVSSKHLSHLDRNFSWQEGYAAFSVSESEVSRVALYIQRQEQWHESVSFKEERQRFLDRHDLGALESLGEDPRTSHHWLGYHIVFSTKKRHSLILPEVERELYASIRAVVHLEGGELIEIGGMPDHLHVLLTMKPKHTLVDMIKHIKGVSSRFLARRACQSHRSCGRQAIVDSQ